jgi:uncharacterized protein YcsI (UPF0317 family)
MTTLEQPATVTPSQAREGTAAEVTASHPVAPGVPVHAGDPAEPGIASLDAADFGDAVKFAPGRMPITGRTDESLAQ